jgi:type II secretory pathway predicted ATPase ExeA
MHYYEYWGCKKAPFDNVPDPTMYVSCHASAHTAISETLFAIEEGNECLAVIVGDVGLGKTMSLRMVMDSLQPGKYQIAFIVNPDMSFVQLLKEIIGQLTGEQCEIKKKMDLLETFNRLLFESAEQGKKVVIFIDEANAMSPATLEKMRLLTNLQPDEVNLFTIVMAGQIEFARRLAHPKRANLFQRVGTYCTLEKIESTQVVREYVQSRLSLAGTTKSIFTDDAIEELWRYSEYGVPRLINKICKLSLKAGETNNLRTIDGNVVSQIGDRFLKVSQYSTKQKTPQPSRPLQVLPEPDVAKANRAVKTRTSTAHVEDISSSGAGTVRKDQYVEPPSTTFVTQAAPEPPMPSEPPQVLTELEEPVLHATFVEPEIAHVEPEAATTPTNDIPDRITVKETILAEHISAPQVPAVDEEIPIDQYGVYVTIPGDVISESRAFNEDQCIKIAGLLAAQTIQKNPRLTATWGADPLAVWSEIREAILTRLKDRDQNRMAS